jgi:hypothetical protein
MDICNKCFNPVCSCKNKKLFDCDEYMIPTIKILNEKGYKTQFCCSGHIIGKDNPSIRAYIMFDKIYKFKQCSNLIRYIHETEPYAKGRKKRTMIDIVPQYVPEKDYAYQLSIIHTINNHLLLWAYRQMWLKI